jgi:predicted dehydrogenase
MANIGGGGVYDIGCYPIVGSRFLFGDEPRRVVSVVERDPVMKTDRLVSAILDYRSGQASFTCSTQLVPYQRFQVFGTKGRIEIQIPFNAPPDKPCRLFVDDGSGLGDSTAREEVFPTSEQYRLQGDEFSRTIQTGGSLEFPLEDAVRNMKVIDAVYRSGDVGGWVEISADA